ASPIFPPSSRWDLSAASTCSCVTSFALRRRSPSFTTMRVGYCTSWSKVQSRGFSQIGTLDSRLVFFDRLQLSDEGADLQFGSDLDRDLSRIVGEPEHEVFSHQSAAGALGLDTDRREGPGRDDDRLAALDLDVEDA